MQQGRVIWDHLHRVKAQGHVTVNKPDLYNLYCFPHVAIVFCTDFGGWGKSTRKLLPKIHQYLCNRTTYECFVCFSTKLKSPSSKYVILRNIVEDLCDKADQKYCKIVNFERSLFTLHDTAPLKLSIVYTKLLSKLPRKKKKINPKNLH